LQACAFAANGSEGTSPLHRVIAACATARIGSIHLYLSGAWFLLCAVAFLSPWRLWRDTAWVAVLECWALLWQA